jgi:glyoxylase-like metal-dependent hydrolase (beta-lactamase superfamily II)
MNVETFTLGPLGTNCHLVWAEGKPGALLIDCAGDGREILAACERRDLELGLIVNTHGHSDHIDALAQLQQDSNADVAIHELDAPMLSDAMLSGAAAFGFPQDDVEPHLLLHAGDTIAVPDTEVIFEVLHTPGHSPGSISLLGEGVLFSGDCLFAGGIGCVDLAGGDERAMMRSLARLARLDPDTVVYPGHGPQTTIGAEIAGNPWLVEDEYDESDEE